MTHQKSIGKRITSVILAFTILLTVFPLTVPAAETVHAQSDRVADPSTMDSWQDFFSITGDISTENAGGVWMDKSVFTDASAFSGTGIALKDPESFLVALSAMAANMSVTGMSHVPTDSILVLDVSGSMNDGNNDVAAELVQAANASIKALLETNSRNRVGVVLYSGSSGVSTNYTTGAVVLLPLGRYTTGSDGRYLNYTRTLSNRNTSEFISLDRELRIEGTDTSPAAVSKEVVGATYMQRGIITAMEQFLADDNEVVVDGQQRKPVLVLMSDGAPSLGSTNFTDPGYNQSNGYNLGTGSGTGAYLGFVSQLSAAYAKARIEEKYGTDALFYTLGLGLSSSDSVAIGVLDPDNARASAALSDFWDSYNAPGATSVTVQSGGRGQSAKVVQVIDTPLEQNYVDRYFEANGSGSNLASALERAFRDIVAAIQLQSSYFPTLISGNEDLSGYISFVDKVGQYMEVKDIKGILINDRLFSGGTLSSSFVEGGGALGTWDNPSALGIEMVAAVRERLGLDSDEVATTLIGLAYEHGQLSYTDENNFSNYIGWYANAAGEYLGFYNEGTTSLPATTGDPDTDPAFIIRSYGYLGAVDSEHGVSESDMMYATVQVRKDIKTGEELVTFAVPAALIPTVTYNVTLEKDGSLSDLTVSGAKKPIRLVYEVALSDDIDPFNVKESVSDEYLLDPLNVNADGSINFYTNRWDHENKTGYGTVNTYSYFNPSRQNDKYYYLEDAPVYTDTNGTLYTGSEQPSADTAFYRSYQIYKKGDSLRTETAYRELSDAAKATAVRADDGTWVIRKGNIHVNLDGYTVHKSENATGTLSEASIPFVDTHNHSIDDTGYSFYVGATLGNNGKLTVMPETGIRLSKLMAKGAADPGTPFTFTLTNLTNEKDGTTYPTRLVKADGTKLDGTVAFADRVATVGLCAGETLYIGGMTENETFLIVEEESVEYLASATGLSEAGTVTVLRNEILPVAFENDARGKGNLTVAKEIEHDFGVSYSIPEGKLFTLEVTLSGIGTANAVFKAEHSADSSVTEIATDENGKFTVLLAHGQQFEVFGLPAGTIAAVVEPDPGTGFTPLYRDNGAYGDGRVTVEKNTVASVVVVNDYSAAEIYPVAITVSGEKHISGTDWQQDYSFEFKLEKLLADGSWQQLGNTETASFGNTSFNFNDAFAGERYTAPGSYYYRIVEIEPSAPLGGFSYDKTVHSFAVHVGDADMDGQLEITEVVSARPDTTFVTETDNGWNVNASFTNKYSLSGTTTVTAEVTKVISNLGGAEKTPSGYTFGLFDSASGEELARLTTTERGFARFVLSYDAKDMSSGSEVFRYILKEIAPDTIPAGWSYSTDELALTVEVTDDGDGTISAVIYAGNERPADAGVSVGATFTNLYDPADAVLPVDFVNKKLNGRDLKAGEFTFEIYSVDPETLERVKALEGKNDSEGNVVFDGVLTYDRVGVYYYLIKEASSDGKGVTVDKTEYRVVVTVTDDNGSLKADYSILNVTGDTVTFVNEYEATPVTHTVDGRKTLLGRTLVNDEFTFMLTELSVNGIDVEAPVNLLAKNQIDGSFSFPTITYGKAGVYSYSVSEVLPIGGKAYGITYDKAVFILTVEILDDGEGRLVIGSETVTLLDGSPVGEVSFVNEYEANPTWAELSGNKTLVGKVNNTLRGGEFEFLLLDSDSDWTPGNERERVKNSALGVIAFTRIDFTTEEDQYFLVKEVNGGETIDGVTYDDTVYRVWVEITDDLKGQLRATVHIFDGDGIPQDSISFVNEYEAEAASVTIGGVKHMVGREMVDGEFSFILREADESFNAVEGAVAMVAHNVNGRFTFAPLSFSEAGIYYFTVSEDTAVSAERVTFDDSVYFVTVEVTDGGSGKLIASEPMIVKKGSSDKAEAIEFTNLYTPVPADLSLDVNVVKTVVSKGDETIGPKGFEFVLTDAEGNADAVIAVTDENGLAKFVLSFTESDVGKTFSYTLTELDGGRENVIYSTAEYAISIAISLNPETNALEATLTVNESSVAEIVAEFENVYDSTPEIPVNPPTGDTKTAALAVLMLASAGTAILLRASGRRRERESEA